MRQRALVFIPLSTSRIDAARCCSWLVAFYMDTHGNRQTAIWPSIHPTWFYIRILLWTQYTYLGIHNMDVWVSVSDRYTLNIKKKKAPYDNNNNINNLLHCVTVFRRHSTVGAHRVSIEYENEDVTSHISNALERSQQMINTFSTMIYYSTYVGEHVLVSCRRSH